MNLVTVVSPEFVDHAIDLIRSFRRFYPDDRVIVCYFGGQVSIAGEGEVQLVEVPMLCDHAHDPRLYFYKTYALQAAMDFDEPFIYLDSPARFIKRPVEVEQRLRAMDRFFVRYPPADIFRTKVCTTRRCMQAMGCEGENYRESHYYWAAIQAYNPSPFNKQFVAEMVKWMRDPTVAGPSNYLASPEPGNPDCLYHRNDQSCLALMIEKYGIHQPFEEEISLKYGDHTCIRALLHQEIDISQLVISSRNPKPEKQPTTSLSHGGPSIFGAASEAAMQCLEEATDLLVRNRFSELEAVLEQDPVQNSDDPRIQRAAGNILLQAGLINKARAKFVLSTRLDPNAPESHLDLAVTWMILQRNTEAEVAARCALELTPRNGAAWKILGQIKLQQKDQVAGVEAYRKSLEFLPDDAECLVLVGSWLRRCGDSEQARPFLEKALRICPTDPGIRSELDKLRAGELQPDLSVTAIVSVYKAERFLRGCLDDLLEQSLWKKGLLEIVVVDTGSPESESDIVREYQSRHGSEKIRLIRTEDRRGLYAAWNLGAQAARGRLLTNANADDRHREDALERQCAELDAHPEVDLVYADEFLTYQENATMARHIRAGIIRKPTFSPDIMMHGCHMGPHPMWRRSVHDRIGWFNEEFKSAGDYEFWCRMALVGMSMRHIPEFLGLYLENPQGICNGDPALAHRETAAIREAYGTKLPRPLANYTDNYVFSVADRRRHVQVAIRTSQFSSNLSQALDSLRNNTAYPHLLTTIEDTRNPRALEILREAARQGVVHRIIEADGETPFGSLETTILEFSPAAERLIVPESIQEFSRRGWLETLLADPPSTPDLGDPNGCRRLSDDPSDIVNIGIVTYNRLEFTRQTLDALLPSLDHPHRITVVDNASQDGTSEYLQDLHRRGLIHNLHLLPENLGIAKASNIAWASEPNAEFYLKLDNDMVPLKRNWLSEMVRTAKAVPGLGALGYSVEPRSYPAESFGKAVVRPKRDANIGGACFLVPRAVHEKLGWWCEDYGLYGEEDGDFALRLRLAGFFNAYMEDENAFFHLPGGKAGAIDPRDLSAVDPEEIRIHEDYRLWKDDLRRELQKPGGLLQRNVVAYHSGQRSLFVPRGQFQGLLGPDLQVFRRGSAWEFHPTSASLTEAHRHAAAEFAATQNPTKQLVEPVEPRPFLTTEPPSSRAPSPDGTNSSGSTPTVSIVIPVHGNLDLTRDCVAALRRTTDPATTEIVIVDDASPDGTAAWLREREAAGELEAVLLPANRGFAHACNTGAAKARGTTLVFLNNDTLPEPGWLEALVAVLSKNPAVGMVGARLLYPDRTIQHAGIHFHPSGMPFHVHRGAAADDPSVLREAAFPAVTGACIAMPADLYRRLGGFDESYRMYVEDIDLCLKVWEAGREVRYCPDSVVVHMESASSTDLERRDEMVRAGLGKLHATWSGRWPQALRMVEGFPASFFGETAISPARVQWISPVWDPSGYADESRAFLKHLARTDLVVSARPWGRHSETFHQAASAADRSILDAALSREALPGSPVVLDIPAHAMGRLPGAGHHVGRTTFETDGLPSEWVARCNAMDEIWVPCAFNRETFAKAGVTKPILVVPEGVDTSKFRPGLAPLDLPGPRKAVTYLAVFEWTHRKAPDLLIQAWATAFTSADDVRLVLRTYPPNQIEGDPIAWVESRIDEELARVGKRRADCAPISAIARQVPDADMPGLYAAADVYLAPSRGEGWGRPHMEAMSCGLPVVATRWSGNLDFQTDNNSWLIEIDGLEEIDAREEFPFYRGQKWAKPSLADFVRILRISRDDRDLRRAKGERARRDMMQKWDWSKIAPLAETRIREILEGVPAERSSLLARSAIRQDVSPRNPSPSSRSIPGSSAPIRWAGPVFNYSGYARLARETLKGLMDAGVPVSCDPQLSDNAFFASLSGKNAEISRWKSLLATEPVPGPLVICDLPRDANGGDILGALQRDNPGCGKRIAWTMFETDRLPEGWASALNTLDEVWVPSRFNRETFAAAGVMGSKLHVVPGCIDATPYAQAHPMTLPGSGYAFLSVFQWIERKGYDVLLDAWAKAFKPTDPVRLVLRCHPFGDAPPVEEQLEAFLSLRGLRRRDLAPIHVLDSFLPDAEMPSLFAACDCFVLPSRGEGWGLPYLEAMASAKPVIGTAWSAQTEFLTTDNSWLLSPRAPVPVTMTENGKATFLDPSHRWADPDPTELARLLRYAFDHQEEGRAKGLRGSEDARSLWTPARTAAAIAARLSAGSAAPGKDIHRPAPPSPPADASISTKVSSALAKVAEGIRTTSHPATSARKVESIDPTTPSAKLSIRWEGSQFVHHSLAHVNRELCLRLARNGHALSLIPFEPDQFAPGDDPDLSLLARLHNAPLDKACQIHVRHQWPPNLEAPAHGNWVVIQPWEFGSPPKQWISAFADRLDDLWVPSSYCRDLYVDGGMPADRVHVVPNGVDCNRFRPGLAPYALATKKTFKFLYVGGTIARKGFDTLLNAWKEAFGPDDDVCLVVKDMGGETFYKGQTAKAWIREMQESRKCAEIEYLDGDMEPNQIPSLYAACDVLVHPYRGEGFGLPIAEAMACGLPCVVTRGGAADDFCGETESWGVQAKRVPVPGGKVGPFETVSPPWWLEPSVPDLVEKLRIAKSDHEARRSKGDAARRRIVEGFTWDKAAAIAEERLLEIASRPPRRSASGPRFVSALDKLSLRITNPGGKLAPATSPEPPGAGVPGGDIDLAELNRLLVGAEAAAARGELGEAEHLTENAVTRFPHQNLAWLARAMVLRGMGNFRKASQAIDRAIKERETPEALLESLQIHLLAGEAAPARKVEKALKERHAAWFKEMREQFRARGQTWPPDLLKPARATNRPAPPARKGKR